ncbi:MAG: hypothetical protein GXO57_08535 [Thermodesulfobacteria bacterium]|nr:hypothetical protein [Thermodesulfobacteriota bacterium]
MKEEKREIYVDPMGLAFGKVMTIFTIIGVILMVAPAIFYFLGKNQYIPLDKAALYWSNATVDFWKHIKGAPVHGYNWIFDNLKYTDCLSMIGVLLLMITPLISMFAAIVKAPQKAYKILLFIAAVEFIISMIVKGVF